MSSKRKENIGNDDLDGYDSSFEDESNSGSRKRSKQLDLTSKEPAPIIQPSGSTKGIPTKEHFQRELARAESYKNRYFALNAYERHKKLINDYFLYHPGAADKLFKRDESRDKRDIDVIRDNHRFLWDDDNEPDTWEKSLAKRYYDKLFKEYCICDLSRYKENKVAMRWRTENELVEGKGQFVCGARKCVNTESLRTWEVNFAYMEESIKKNALVKLRLCPKCSDMLNYGQKRREVLKKSKKRSHSSKHKKHSKRQSKNRDRDRSPQENNSSSLNQDKSTIEEDAPSSSANIWKERLVVPELKSREEEFEEYLDDLFV